MGLYARHPLFSNCIVYGGITGFTELTQQTVQLKLIPYWSGEKAKRYDLASIAR